jgi:hypothetical protein
LRGAYRVLTRMNGISAVKLTLPALQLERFHGRRSRRSIQSWLRHPGRCPMRHCNMAAAALECSEMTVRWGSMGP